MSGDAGGMLDGLLAAARLTVPDDLAQFVVEHGEALGAHSLSVYLIDHEQYLLVPLPGPDGDGRAPLSVDTTLAGRCFRQLELQVADEGRQVWVPLLDGLERLGVLQLEFRDTAERAGDAQLHQFAAIVAEIVMVKGAYGDLFALVRRRREMSLAAEVAWNLLPPLTFGTDRLVISCVLAPAYEVGGDSFDYAVDATTARFAVFDAMGHGIGAGLLATVAMGAYRAARRRRLSLLETVATIDDALSETFTSEQFVTAVLAELDLASGRLRWHSAGHPEPLLLRGSRVVKSLAADAGVPLGLASRLGQRPQLSEESLEPGDRLLLFTDGVVEARADDGQLFGVDRLVDLVGKHAAAGMPAPETMRRLMHALLAHQEGRLDDDATTMLVEWRTAGEQRIAP